MSYSITYVPQKTSIYILQKLELNKPERVQTSKPQVNSFITITMELKKAKDHNLAIYS